MKKIKNVLFLCSGNTSRSPAAEYLAKWLKETKYKGQLKDVNFDSAGLYSYYKTPQPGTTSYLDSKEINYSDFLGKQITEDLIKKQDLILGFERKWHIRKLKRRFKDLDDLDEKTNLLLEFAGDVEDVEVADPINFEDNKYKHVMERIEYGVDKTLQKIIKINKKSERN